MVDIMGFFDFLKVGKGHEDVPLVQRWVSTSDGLIRDSAREMQPVWIIGTNYFESWIQGVEERTNQSLGRRLAHAAAESEEYMLLKGKSYSMPKGGNPDTWNSLQNDWMSRGIGYFSSLDSSNEEKRIVVVKPAYGPICAGFIASAVETSSNIRHRFRWSESKDQSLIVSLSPDQSEVPPPRKMKTFWVDNESEKCNSELFETLEIGHNGSWAIMGNRCMVIHRDLILRFAEYCEPYLDEIHTGYDNYIFSGNSQDENLMWTAMADSIRKSTFESAPHILISKPDDWKRVTSRHLSLHGLGNVSSVDAIDSHGGVKLSLSGCFHPAISGGVLLACWERAYGRRGKLQCDINSGAVSLFLSSSVALVN